VQLGGQEVISLAFTLGGRHDPLGSCYIRRTHVICRRQMAGALLDLEGNMRLPLKKPRTGTLRVQYTVRILCHTNVFIVRQEERLVPEAHVNQHFRVALR
jgi:hypothetical protein